MIIRRKLYAVVENPNTLQKLSPAFRNQQNSARWKEFNKDTGGSNFRLNTGDTRKSFHEWQQNKYGNIV